MKTRIGLALAGLLLTSLLAAPAVGQEKEQAEAQQGNYQAMKRDLRQEHMQQTGEFRRSRRDAAQHEQEMRKEHMLKISEFRRSRRAAT